MVWIDLMHHAGFISQWRRLFCVCSIAIIVVIAVEVLAPLIASLILRGKKTHPKQTNTSPKETKNPQNKKSPKQKPPIDNMFSNRKICWKQLSAYVLSIVFWLLLQCYMLMSLDLISEDSSLCAFYITSWEKQLHSNYALTT